MTTHYPPSTGFGGVTESGFQLSNALAGAGVNVSVLTSDASLESRIPADDFGAFENASLSIYPYHHIVSKKSAPSITGHQQIRQLVRDSDIVHINGIYTWPVTVAAWYAQKYKKPHIVALRNGLDPFMFQIRQSKKMLGFRLYVRSILQKANIIHATANQEVVHAKNFGIEGEFVVIPNGIDTVLPENLATPANADDFWPALRGKRVVLFLSRLSPQKGLDMLIPIWSAVAQQVKDAVLVIAGPDYQGYEKNVRQLVADCDVTDSIVMTGEVRDERKWALYKRADFFVLPSYSENFGNVIAAALAFKTPVITTTATPWTQLDQYQCGRCVPPQPAELEKALRELLSLPRARLADMGENAASLLKSMNTWEQSAQDFISVYKTLPSKN